uniref:Replication protein n=1 Tax=Steinernema glaseri TaxID=37863 RepID=A0A1I7YE03_9BILA
KDDLESWFYVMIDWLTKLKLRMCNDDVEKGHIARLKLSCRYGADGRYLLTPHDESDVLSGKEEEMERKGEISDLPFSEINEILRYIDSLEFYEKPNYEHIYDILDGIMDRYGLEPFPLDWER